MTHILILGDFFKRFFDTKQTLSTNVETVTSTNVETVTSTNVETVISTLSKLMKYFVEVDEVLCQSR